MAAVVLGDWELVVHLTQLGVSHVWESAVFVWETPTVNGFDIALSTLSHTLSHTHKLQLSSPRHRTPSSTTDGPHLTPDTPTTNDREVPTPPPMTPDPPEPQSPSEFLHRIPAVHVGSAKAGRHDSVNDVIQKVLLDHTPTGSREVSVWLSLAQLRLVDMSDEREMVYEAHETSRIRAIGVCLEDKRFIGYIIKEEGKPLVGHVLRCNSAALMVSLVSFLRQACQIMFSQQGGSLYDELSSDESDLESSNEVGVCVCQCVVFIV